WGNGTGSTQLRLRARLRQLQLSVGAGDCGWRRQLWYMLLHAAVGPRSSCFLGGVCWALLPPFDWRRNIRERLAVVAAGATTGTAKPDVAVLVLIHAVDVADVQAMLLGDVLE